MKSNFLLSILHLLQQIPEYGDYLLEVKNRQIWLTMFITLLPNSNLWIIHMVGYHCSSLRNIGTKITRHTNDEYELFTHVHTSKCVVTTELYYTLERVLNLFSLDHSVREKADVI